MLDGRAGVAHTLARKSSVLRGFRVGSSVGIRPALRATDPTRMTATSTLRETRPEPHDREFSVGNPPESTQAPVPAPLRIYSVFVTVAVLLLIKVGAWVTSTGSGMAYEDWPLANGSLWPPNMKLDGFLEHGHRAFGATIGLLMIGLVAMVYRYDTRSSTRRAAVALLIAVIVQGIIGGVGVLENLPAVTSVTHGVLAQCILCGTAALAFACSKGWNTVRTAPTNRVRTARRLSVVALVVIGAQLVMGAIARHESVLPVLWAHVFSALVVSITIMIASSFAAGRLGTVVPGFVRDGRWIIGLLLVQLTLGFFSLAFRSPKDPSNIEHLGRAAVISAHVVTGAALFLMATVLCARTFRNVKPEGARPQEMPA